MGEVIDVTDATINKDILRSNLPTEVDIRAPWCGPRRIFYLFIINFGRI
jgi:hypothetical protein